MKIRCQNCSSTKLYYTERPEKVYVKGLHYPVVWCKNCYLSYSSHCQECHTIMHGDLIDRNTGMCEGCSVTCDCGDVTTHKYMCDLPPNYESDPLGEIEHVCTECYKNKYEQE